jgi:NADH-quinone oxidoreductase subunit F
MLERIARGEATPMDLDIMASVQENIMGHCLCVLGDAMAMPISSMIRHFREEFEEHMERMALSATELSRDPNAGAYEPLEPVGAATPNLG